MYCEISCRLTGIFRSNCRPLENVWKAGHSMISKTFFKINGSDYLYSNWISLRGVVYNGCVKHNGKRNPYGNSYW